jgi:hypothetical protein
MIEVPRPRDAQCFAGAGQFDPVEPERSHRGALGA